MLESIVLVFVMYAGLISAGLLDMPMCMWIGLYHDHAYGGEVNVWTDNTDHSYFRWASGEPSRIEVNTSNL